MYSPCYHNTDLYSGNLLADVAQDHKDNLDRTKKGDDSIQALTAFI